MSTALHQLHRRLLPDNPDIGYTPYLWLFYLLFLLPGLYLKSWSTTVVVASVLSIAAFLPFYFRGFWLQDDARLWRNILLIVLIGVALLPLNPGASVYFVYAAAGCAIMQPWQKPVAIIVALAVLLLLESWLLNFPLIALVMPTAFVLLIGCANLFQGAMFRKNARLRMTQAEVSQLAKVAERERISRDLHDLLGHSLSVITLKAELAGKLLQREHTDKAANEIRDLENISRQALADVREAVSGYRNTGLREELQRAADSMHAAGISLDTSGALELIPVSLDASMAMLVREAVTNCIRHANASRCQIRWQRNGGQLSLVIRDNGGGIAKEQLDEVLADNHTGNGLAGMSERIKALGGTLELHNDNGLQLHIMLPLADAVSSEHTSQDDLLQARIL